MDEKVKFFVERQKEFLGFMKSRYSLFHESNVFFRDLHYAVMAFLTVNKLPMGYVPAEDLTKRIISAYEDTKVFLRIDERTWMLNYPAMKTVTTKPAPVAKAAAPTPKPAGLPASAPPKVPSTSAMA
ncbi:MAG TPA: hypothetical protein VI758_11450 [Bacteroidota bacterium]